VLDDVSDRFAHASGLHYLGEAAPAALRRSSAVAARSRFAMHRLRSWWGRGGSHAGSGSAAGSEATLQHVGGSQLDPLSPRPSDAPSEFFGRKASTEGSASAAGHGTLVASPSVEKSSAFAAAAMALVGSGSMSASTSGAGSGAGAIPIVMPRQRGRFAQAVHNMMLMQRTVGMSQLAPDSPARRRTHSDGVLSGSNAGPASAVRSNRLAALTPKLQCLETTQDLAAHSALVRHLMFSPDGKYLATCRCAIR
jgi:hypothetical protein